MQQRSANEKFSTTLSRLDCFARCDSREIQILNNSTGRDNVAY